jgi:hypothetical protein
MRKDRMVALIKAVERREQVAAAITKKHKDMQRELLNFVAVLNAVYKGRCKLAEEALSKAQQGPDMPQKDDAAHPAIAIPKQDVSRR